ncbi:MAG: DUF3299 domain-containing protein [Burkholderiales bacterium]|nr:DUF3299 domain-containing protein [Burkholderiales bacterium]
MKLSIAMRSFLAPFALAATFLTSTVLAQLPPPPKQTGPVVVDPAPAGTIPWPLLQQAKTIQLPNKKFGPQFTKEIKELDKQEVKLYGFMMPLDQSEKQKRFLLAAWPPHCNFCMPGGPESLIEVLATEPIKFSYEPIVLSGKMHVLENDIVYYRLTDAKSVKF